MISNPRVLRLALLVEPGTAMPNLGVSEEQATDVAAYLFTLGR